MNEAHKKALRIHHPDLTQDLDLTADLVAKLIHSGILNEDMIEDIKNEKTRKERVQKLLLTLPRRGPRAFDKFVCALGDHYWWLADALRKTYHKISLHTEPEMLSLKKKVDIYVHERFGNSKRLCEDDKKEIRHFLYSYLKSHKEEDDPLFAVEQSRRNSLESNASDIRNQLNTVSEKDIEVNVLARVYSMLASDSKQGDSDEFDSVDGPGYITIDMVEKRVKELNRRVDSLQNEINDCYTVLGVEESDQPLHEVLKSIHDDRIVDRKRLGRLRDKIDALEKQRCELDKTIKNQQKEINEREEKIQKQHRELNETINKLADTEHKNEKSDVFSQELREERDKLKDRCDKLEQIHLKHVEKQQTLMTLKSMVHKLAPQPKHSNDPDWLKSSNKKDDSLQLPNLSPVRVNRQGRQSHAAIQERSLIHHHEYPKPRISQHGTPWK